MWARRRPPESPRPDRRALASLFSRSATRHKSCQREFFSKKSFRQPVLACFVLVQAPAAPGPARFQVRGPPLPASIQQEPCQPLPLPQFYIIFTVGFLPKEKPPRAQTPRGFRSSMTRVLPGKVFSQRTPRALRLFPRRTRPGSSLDGSDLHIL